MSLGNCVKCSARGHSCVAQTTDLDDRPLCYWCADGEPCPYDLKHPGQPGDPKVVQKEQPMPKKKPAPAPLTAEKVRTAVKQIHAAAVVDDPRPTPDPSRPAAGKRKVASPYCSNRCYQRDWWDAHPRKPKTAFAEVNQAYNELQERLPIEKLETPVFRVPLKITKEDPKRTLWRAKLRIQDSKDEFLFRERNDFALAADTATRLLEESPSAKLTGAEIVAVERVAHLWN